MSVLSQLSSQTGDRTEQSNIKVVEQCLKNPALLKEITSGLKDKDVKLVGDCAEVLTKVAETKPELISPFAKDLITLLDNKNTRVRWEAMHSIALITPHAPDVILPILSHLHRMSLSDPSTIVRDYSVVAIGSLAKTSKQAAKDALPVLKRVLEVWKEKQAARALKGLQNAAETDPNLSGEVIKLAKPFENSIKGTAKKAAKDVIKFLNK